MVSIRSPGPVSTGPGVTPEFLIRNNKLSVLPQEFYFSKTEKVAIQLLGKVLYFKTKNGEVLSGRIVETEAYLGVKDPAAHTFGDRKTERTKSMYRAGGHSYVYLIYGMYNCLNFVTQAEGTPEAVLIRALQPVHISAEKIAKKQLYTNGPGKLCKHFGITREHNGLPLWEKESGLWVEDEGFKVKPSELVKTSRIGVDYAGEAAEWPLRFYLKQSPWVSRP
jgi:DNA-3-methyladenine glycosylase